MKMEYNIGDKVIVTANDNILRSFKINSEIKTNDVRTITNKYTVERGDKKKEFYWLDGLKDIGVSPHMIRLYSVKEARQSENKTNNTNLQSFLLTQKENRMEFNEFCARKDINVIDYELFDMGTQKYIIVKFNYVTTSQFELPATVDF